MHGAHNTCRNACITLRKKCTCTRACAPMQRCINFFAWKYCELILSIARASCRLSFADRPGISTKSVARRCSLEKSVQIHASSWRGRRCGVAQTSFNHPRWWRPDPVCLRWWRPHPVCLWFVLEAWSWSSPITEIYFHHFSAYAHGLTCASMTPPNTPKHHYSDSQSMDKHAYT